MTRARLRWAVAGAVAVAGAFGGVVPGATTADAGPSASPFAGQYVGLIPYVGGVAGYPWDITIRNSGAVKGSSSYTVRFPHKYEFWHETWSGLFAGSIDANGMLEITGELTDKLNGGISYTATFESTLAVTKNASGDLIVTSVATGASAIWTLE